MSAAFNTEDRRKGFETMTKQLTPAGRVRRRFLQGRPAKKDVIHTPLSAIGAAVDAITEVLRYVEAKEPTLSLDSVEVGLVYLLNGIAFNRKIYSDPKRISALFNELIALPKFVCIGLTFTIQEIIREGLHVGGWVTPFIWSDETVMMLGGSLEKLLGRARQEFKDAQAAEAMVDRFIADSRGLPFEIFHIIMLDGSFWPPSAERRVLVEAVQRFGCAGFIGIAKAGRDVNGMQPFRQMIKTLNESPEAKSALVAAAAALNPSNIHAPTEGVCSEK
jgi:hypothetical protein